MAKSSFSNRMAVIGSVLAAVLIFAAPDVTHAQANKVETYKDEKGWKLKVDGEDFYIKGVVWGYTPRGQNYTYGLFNEPDDFIRKVLDYEFGLMKKMGVNTIRSFTTIPPRWVEYIYREHGIMSVINPLMGRYGYTVNGQWVPFTDYSDPATREVLKRDMQEFVRTYKATPGVLMFAFGNESNYGLSWSSFEIENLPEGEQNTAKARYLYSLYEEVISAGKEIAPNHPFSIVNGDIQYIDLIAELVPSLDILGSNVYRGTSFTDLWRRVDDILDLPVVFFEFGSDAFNARTFQEDQVAQALILKEQWQEMYNKAYGNGEEGNSIGGYIFEWRDEWWKYLQTENLDIQDTNASWSNQAYLFDWTPDGNNMNEEWFGITALGMPNAEGVYEAIPRMAYDVMKEIFALDPYEASRSEINAMFATMDVDYYELKGDVRRVKAQVDEKSRTLRFTGGRLQAEFVARGEDQPIEEDGENAIEFSDGQMVFLDFAFNPSSKLNGQFTLNVLGDVADKRPLEFSYGDRGLEREINVATEEIEGLSVSPVRIDDGRRIEIYDFSAEYQGEAFDLEAFYHTPRYHWGYEGDFFGLVHEATDIAGIDIWDANAPSGVEIRGKGSFDGLTLLFGPEIYWGANPKFVVKYDFGLADMDWTFIHSEDVARLGSAVGGAGQTERQSRQTTIYGKKEFSNGWELEVGGIMSATEKVGEAFDRIDSNGDIYLDEIDWEDTLGLKAKVTFPLMGTRTYLSAHHAGLVADGGQHHKVYGVSDPSNLPYSGLGNKQEYEAGTQMFFGNWMIFPRLMYRDNLVHANPLIEPEIIDGILYPGTNPRNRDADPFAVLGNREARAAEIYFTWDPTGATPYYDWDNEWREDAPFAIDFGGTYTEFPTFTDSYQFFFAPTESNASFGQGLPAEDVWTVSSRVTFNTKNRTKLIFKGLRGFQQSTGNPNGGTRDFWELHGKAVWGGKHTLSGYFLKDAWGPYDFYRQFNVTFPEQIKLDYSYLLGPGYSAIADRVSEDHATKIGVRALYRSFGEGSEAEEEYPGSDYIFSINVYFIYQF